MDRDRKDRRDRTDRGVGNVDYNEEHVQLYSFWPILLAAGIILIPIGILSLWEISAIGALVVLTAIMGWAWEARSEPREEQDE